MKVTTPTDGLSLTQQKYAPTVTANFRANLFPILLLSTQLSVHNDRLLEDSYTYRQLVGTLQLQYLTFTRPNISYVVNLVAQFLHRPCEWSKAFFVTFVAPYNTVSNSSATLMPPYCLSSHCWCLDTRHSTSGFGIFFGRNLISWSAKKQPTISSSSLKADYHFVSFTLAETIWIHRLLCDIDGTTTAPNLQILTISILHILLLIQSYMHAPSKSSLTIISYRRKFKQVTFPYFISKYQLADLHQIIDHLMFFCTSFPVFTSGCEMLKLRGNISVDLFMIT